MADNTNTKLLERERIIFLQGIKEKDAIELSNKYPNLVIFSNGDKFSDVWNGTQYNDQSYQDNDSIKYDTDTILGCSIIKNGVSYTIVKGVHPKRNCIKLKIGEDNERNLRIYLDKNGLINFIYGDYEIKFNNNGTIIQTKYIASGDTLGDLPIPEKKYTITWDANGGIFPNGNSKILVDINYNWDDLNNYWSSIENSTNNADKIDNDIVATGDQTYYACWNDNIYYNGAECNDKYLDYIKPENVGSTSRKYYKLRVWRWELNGTGINALSITDTRNLLKNINNNIIIQANWLPYSYCWYVGKEKQNSNQYKNNLQMASNDTSEGWRNISGLPSNYTKTNPLFNSIINPIPFSNVGIESSYIYLPKDCVDDGYGIFDILGNETGWYIKTGTNITIKYTDHNGNNLDVEYIEYHCELVHNGFAGMLIYKK